MTFQWQDPIDEKPCAMPGKPVFKGAWLAVEHVLNDWGIGVSESDFFLGYPPLRHDPLRAAMLYAVAMRMDV